MNSKISIVIADDHPLIRKGLREVILEVDHYDIVAEAGDGGTAIKMIELHKPNVAIIDINMPKMLGSEVAKFVQEKGLPVDVIILTMVDDYDTFYDALDCGIKGYVLKENALTEILACLESIGKGKPYYSPSLSMHIFHENTDRKKKENIQQLLALLSEAERKVLSFIGQKFSTKEIADKLFLSPRTVDNHRANIASKLQLKGKNALLLFVLENKQFIN